ncbi:MAG: hypothetical protein LBV67_09620 [Streptococcaceae bacterium]|jgi:hypothetical protein|nr:hypothetical protein [Streptococcaceae bacterium]
MKYSRFEFVGENPSAFDIDFLKNQELYLPDLFPDFEGYYPSILETTRLKKSIKEKVINVNKPRYTFIGENVSTFDIDFLANQEMYLSNDTDELYSRYPSIEEVEKQKNARPDNYDFGDDYWRYIEAQQKIHEETNFNIVMGIY